MLVPLAIPVFFDDPVELPLDVVDSVLVGPASAHVVARFFIGEPVLEIRAEQLPLIDQLMLDHQVFYILLHIVYELVVDPLKIL